MKKKLLIFIPTIIVITLVSLLIYYKVNPRVNVKKYELTEEYYKSSKYIEINSKTLEELINNKESFVLFVYQPMCIASSNFNAVLDEFIKENYLTIYKISYENLKKTNLKKQIKHYPSFLTFYKGSLTDYLDAEKDEDVKYFKKTQDFTKWLSEHITLKHKDTNNNEENNIKEQIEELKKTEITLENISKEPGKVNIYLFWGDGCPHCKEEKEFLNSIASTHGHLFNLHTFEVWYNSDNRKILQVFGAYNNTIVDGVPYTVIGEKTFEGFSENTKSKIIEAIEEESKKNYDIYIDVIKNQAS